MWQRLRPWMRAAAGGLVLAWLALWAAAGPVAAGPWPRAQGAVFLSFGQEIGVATGRGETGIYLEYGLGRDWTVVLDAGLSDGGGTDRARVALRRSFPPASGAGLIWAAEVGLGAERLATGGALPVLRAGLSLGRGLEVPRRQGLAGWSSLDLAAEARRGGVGFKAEATLGLKPTPRLMTILQLQAERAPAGTVTTHVAPSVVWRLREGLELQLGLRARMGSQPDRRLKLATWVSF